MYARPYVCMCMLLYSVCVMFMIGSRGRWPFPPMKPRTPRQTRCRAASLSPEHRSSSSPPANTVALHTRPHNNTALRAAGET